MVHGFGDFLASSSLRGTESASSESDLTGVFCTSGSEREFTLEERWYAHETV